MANTKQFSKTRKNSFKKRNNKLNTQKGGINIFPKARKAAKAAKEAAIKAKEAQKIVKESQNSEENIKLFDNNNEKLFNKYKFTLSKSNNNNNDNIVKTLNSNKFSKIVINNNNIEEILLDEYLYEEFKAILDFDDNEFHKKIKSIEDLINIITNKNASSNQNLQQLKRENLLLEKEMENKFGKNVTVHIKKNHNNKNKIDKIDNQVYIFCNLQTVFDIECNAIFETILKIPYYTQLNNSYKEKIEGYKKYSNANHKFFKKQNNKKQRELLLAQEQQQKEKNKEILKKYFYNKSKIQKNYNGKHLNKRIHILTKKKINNVNKKVSNNTKVNNTVNSLFKQGNKSYIQPEMLTLLKNTFTSKRELLEFLRELKKEQNNKNNENPYVNMTNNNKKQVLIEYFRNNRIDRINKELLEIIKKDRHSYTVNQAIHLIFCNFNKNPPCKINENKQTELEDYANGNINTLLDFIDELLKLDNENVYENMSSAVNVNQKYRNDLKTYFLKNFSEYENDKNINKINMDFFIKINQFVKSNDENTTTSQGPYEIGHYDTINTNNNSNKYTFDEIVENLFSCKITQNNKNKMECKIEIDMIKKLKEYTKNIKTLVVFLSELLEKAGINTNEYASLEEIRLPETPYTSYMSESSINEVSPPPVPSRSSNPVQQRFRVNNSGYAHLPKKPRTKTHKNNTYSQLNRGNTVYAEPNFITNDNDNDIYATVFPWATVDRQNVAQPNNPNFIKHYKPITFSGRRSKASTLKRAPSSSTRI